MNLSAHFTLEEMIFSDTALADGIDNTPSPEIVANLTRLAMFLEEVRAALGGHPLQITSGFRCPALNEAVGGVHDSEHLFGLAADFECPAVGTPLVICARLRGTPGLDYDQLINEADGRGDRWVHIGIAAIDKAPRLEVWTIDAEGTRQGL